MEPTYHLEGVIRSKEEMADFEGPLNLILMLLGKNKIEIRDIPISEISEQYLAYLDEMKSMDLEVASEFVQMAAHLLYIKSKMLLTSEEEPPDELEMLIASLEQLRARDIHAAVKDAAPALLRASEYGAGYFTKEPEPLQGVKEYRYSHESWELLLALKNALLRARTSADAEAAEEETRRRRIVPKRIVYPVREKSREILTLLSARGLLPLAEFYRLSRSRSEVVATFVSILELCSHGHARLERAADGALDVRFTGGDTEKILESMDERLE